jgi:hypothetical protein
LRLPITRIAWNLGLPNSETALIVAHPVEVSNGNQSFMTVGHNNERSPRETVPPMMRHHFDENDTSKGLKDFVQIRLSLVKAEVHDVDRNCICIVCMFGFRRRFGLAMFCFLSLPHGKVTAAVYVVAD